MTDHGVLFASTIMSFIFYFIRFNYFTELTLYHLKVPRKCEYVGCGLNAKLYLSKTFMLAVTGLNSINGVKLFFVGGWYFSKKISNK